MIRLVYPDSLDPALEKARRYHHHNSTTCSVDAQTIRPAEPPSDKLEEEHMTGPPFLAMCDTTHVGRNTHDATIHDAYTRGKESDIRKGIPTTQQGSYEFVEDAAIGNITYHAHYCLWTVSPHSFGLTTVP